MNPPFPSSSPNVGRFTAVILGFVVFVCVTMIGGTGYLKYQLDRAETILAAPDAALGTDQELFDRLRRDLGYGGFLGLAQNYALAHDASGFATMKDDIKSADDIIAHLPDHTPAETRHDLTAIVSTFDAALKRINAPANEAPEFTVSDLTPLYAALPILNARIESSTGETRLAAQNQMQFWAMCLTLVSWCSLIIAAACAAGIYLTIRDKQAAPLRALAQSIQNMARGDMRTAIWGVERQDMVGELARAVDIARYHFSHLPDISVLSEQGPVRMRFEGEARSLFEAMMRAISRDSENIRDHASTLNETVSQQKHSISSLTETVEQVLKNILQSGQNGDLQIKQAIHDMASSAENLKNAHAHAADQLNRMLPYIQDRVHGMAEIAQITGKQVAQTLQSLTVSELGMKANTEQAKEMLTRLSSTADDLGERMFGAINLLQAGGKVLSETTEKINGRLLSESDGPHVFERPSVSEMPVGLSLEALTPLTQGLDRVAAQITGLAAKLETQQNQTIATEVVDYKLIADQLRGEQRAIENALEGIQAKLDALSLATHEAARHQLVSENEAGQLAPAVLSGIEVLLVERVESKLAELHYAVKQNEGAAQGIDNVRSEIAEVGRTIVAGIQQKIDGLAGNIDQNVRMVLGEGQATQGQLHAVSQVLGGIERGLDQTKQDIISNNSVLLNQLAELHDAVKQNEGTAQGIGIVRGEIAEIGRNIVVEVQQKIDGLAGHVDQNVRMVLGEGQATQAQLHAVSQTLGGIERGLEQNKQDIISNNGLLLNQSAAYFAAQASDISAAIERGFEQNKQDIISNNGVLLNQSAAQFAAQASDISAASAATRTLLLELADKVSSMAQALPPDMQQRMKDQWYQIAAQVEASRTSIEKLFVENVSGKLASFEDTVKRTYTLVEEAKHVIDNPPRVTYSLPAELQKQITDQWFQVAAQVEASRNSLIETLSHQIESLESRLTDSASNRGLSKSVADYGTQRQIEQQTQILSELVSALSMLDTHMQQIQTEINAKAR